MAKGQRKQGKKKNAKNDARPSGLNGNALNGKRGPNRKRHAHASIATNNTDNDLRTAVEAGTAFVHIDGSYLLSTHCISDGTMEIVDMEPDGNCLFRSLSDQLFRDHGSNHGEVRQDVCDFMEGHMDEFKVFLVLDDEEASEEDASDFGT